MSETSDENIYLTELEVCKILGLSRQKVISLSEAGVLTLYYRHRSRLYDPEEVRAFIIKATTSNKKPQTIAEMQTIGEDHE